MHDYPGYIPWKALWNACCEISVKACKPHSYPGSLRTWAEHYIQVHISLIQLHTPSFLIISFEHVVPRKQIQNEDVFPSDLINWPIVSEPNWWTKQLLTDLPQASHHFCFDVRHCWIPFYMTKYSLHIGVKKYMYGRTTHLLLHTATANMHVT